MTSLEQMRKSGTEIVPVPGTSRESLKQMVEWVAKKTGRTISIELPPANIPNEFTDEPTKIPGFDKLSERQQEIVKVGLTTCLDYLNRPHILDDFPNHNERILWLETELQGRFSPQSTEIKTGVPDDYANTIFQFYKKSRLGANGNAIMVSAINRLSELSDVPPDSPLVAVQKYATEAAEKIKEIVPMDPGDWDKLETSEKEVVADALIVMATTVLEKAGLVSPPQESKLEQLAA